MNLPEGALLPNEIERKQIFYALKMWSSYTAWKRILDFYQAWADATERSLREASAKNLEGESSIRAGELVFILKGLADLDEAVTRLKKGDKRIFKYTPYAELTHADRPLSHWGRKLGPMGLIDTGDIYIDIAHTPYWHEFERTALALMSAWSECSFDAIQPNFHGEVGKGAMTFLNAHLKERLDQMLFPDPLAAVPDPAESLFVASGSHVKHSGVWEPVEAPAPKMFGFLKSASPKGPFPIVGTMAYLHGGTNAPNMAVYGDLDGARCTWRLLWKDDRYEDGTIPEEEKHYVFLQPEPVEETRGQTPNAPAESLTVAESGQKAPVAGRWLVEDDLHASMEVAAGEELPLHKGRKVRWTLAAGNA